MTLGVALACLLSLWLWLTSPEKAWGQQHLPVELPATEVQVEERFRARDLPGTEATLRRALVERPRDPELQRRLAEVLSWQQRLPEALQHYREALNLAPRDRKIRLGLARVLAWSGQTREATQWFDVLLQENPEDVEALVGRAMIARWKGERRAARALLEQALLHRPDDAAARAELARLELESGNRRAAVRQVERALAVDPTLYEARQAERAIEEAMRPRFQLRTSYSDESSDFDRMHSAAMVETFLDPDTWLRAKPGYTRFADDAGDLDRVSLGAEIRRTLPLRLTSTLRYFAHKPAGSAATHEWGGELEAKPFDRSFELRIGARRRALTDTPLGFEDVAYLDGVGSGGSTIAAIEDRLQIREGYFGTSASPWKGTYAYAEGSSGRVSDDNDNGTVTAGMGLDLLELLGKAENQHLWMKYDYFYLSFEEEAADYFSPDDFQVHTPGLEWRWHPSASAVLGLEAGIPLRSGVRSGWMAAGFVRFPLLGRLHLEARIRAFDDTEFRITSGTVALVSSF